ncbi:uvrD/REP helicase N-terminal domain protein [Neorickettsia helminthoeca str. Oregon]|uniref:DNA 3'-5' helicase n=1 Tax=Neorickettsia helminthoeca str. Oregon TaxID=1286528 RepID=X5HJM0_9RICK|nr:UvrD-helicase domain-containing protein [Neorickettsia helminthoeca]AHX11294.1 uvrD/REP helicase N-terminal domain protein [Neorickettsia helminthoeca str. Oregon]
MSLNNEQRLAIETINGPLLILAGAGTGKTKTLVHRIANLIKEGYAYPNQIMAVTFANKAAKEMMHRITEIVGEAQFNWIGTFHAIAAKILRIEAEKIGFRPDFTILDTDDQMRMLQKIAKEVQIETDKSLIKKYLTIISNWKDKAFTPGRVKYNNAANTWFEKQALCIYELYQERLKENNSMDFGDLLMHNVSLFKKDAEVLERYREKFKYIMVDEYQDTNLCQYLWLRLLAQKHSNICCVGDDDQSIYGWRGAEVGNILRFSQDFDGAKVIKLEQNYRSTNKILSAAHNVIRNNQARLTKKLWTAEPGGEEIQILTYIDSEQEARAIVRMIKERASVCDYSDTAILVRAGFQTRAFEEAAISQQLPYKVIGGLRFYDRKEVKDIIAYLRFVTNPSDNLAFERIINSPKRGLGTASLNKIYNFSLENGCSMFEASIRLSEDGTLKGKILPDFIEKVKKWQLESVNYSLHDFLKKITIESGYISALREQDESRLENIDEIFRVVQEFDNAIDFLQHVSLLTDNDSQLYNSNAINIMTLHASKGLEFEQVFLPGWEDGTFPHARSLYSADQIEEERRLAYVGITRAKKFLTITNARRRLMKNCWQNTSKSRFLLELIQE